MSSKGPAIIIFSKGTDAGTVKTRLHPFLHERQRMTLHLAFLQDTLMTAESLQIPGYLYVSGEATFPFSCSFPILAQNGKDLGVRLKNAFLTQFEKHETLIVIGTDSPDLLAKQIRVALDQLRNHEVVLGPAEDGGYYLLGLSRMIPEIFEDIPWGTAAVLKQTLERVKTRSVYLLEKHYDVDVIQDLVRLKNNLQDNSIAAHTRHWFQQNKDVFKVQPDGTLQSALE